MDRYETVVLVGPTASGKSAVGVELARRVGGEIISADSRAIYRGMDIGTAKPTTAEMGGVPHWGIDLVEPDERFTAVDFKEYVLLKLQQIRDRKRVPVVVGGTGLYIDALVYDYGFNSVVKNTHSDRERVNKSFLQLGIEVERAVLKVRIAMRIEGMFDEPLYEETRRLAAQYDWGLQSMRSNIYSYVWKYLQGDITLEEAKLLAIRDDMSLAKRQMTWFRRNKQIVWLPADKIVTFAAGKLAKTAGV
jgi:tRNA dimethylallyltransferase